MSIFKKHRFCNGQTILEASTNQNFANTDYQKVVGNFNGDVNNEGYLLTASGGRLTFIGKSGSLFLLNGVSDLKVSKATTIVYALFKNGVLVPRAETPHDFTSAAKTETIAITAILSLNKNDYLEVYIKSSDATAVLTVENLQVTLWGRSEH